MANVVTFNGQALPSWVKVTGITFPALPEIDTRESIVPRRYGNIDSGVKFGGKPFKLSVMILQDETASLHHRADELKQWLRGDNWGPSKLVFLEQPNKYYMARASGSVDIEDLFYIGSGDIELYASDPTKYDVDLTQVAGTTAGVSVRYLGQEKAPVIITINVVADCKDLEMTHKETGNKIYLRGNFNSGQTVVLDSSKKLVKVNDTNAMQLLDFNSRWLYVENGSNTFTGRTLTSDVVNSIAVQYRRAD